MGAKASRSRVSSPASSPSVSPRPRASAEPQPPPRASPPSQYGNISPEIKAATEAARIYAQSFASHQKSQSNDWEMLPPTLAGLAIHPNPIAEDDEAIFQRINAKLEKIPLLTTIETKTGISKLSIVFFTCFIVLLMIAHLAGASSIVNFVAFIYPAYMSYKTLQGEDVVMHRHWLIYWVVYGLFHVCEIIGDVTLYWIPYYYPLKIVFLVWCFHPHYRGCTIMYEHTMRPYMLENQLYIDDAVERITIGISRAATEIRQVTTDLLLQIALNVVRTVTGRDQPPRSSPRRPPVRDGVGQWMESPHVSPAIQDRTLSSQPSIE